GTACGHLRRLGSTSEAANLATGTGSYAGSSGTAVAYGIVEMACAGGGPAGWAMGAVVRVPEGLTRGSTEPSVTSRLTAPPKLWLPLAVTCTLPARRSPGRAGTEGTSIGIRAERPSKAIGPIRSQG